LKDELVTLSLTASERLILANQYTILAALFPSRSAQYTARRRLVEKGLPAEHFALLLPDEASSPRHRRRSTSAANRRAKSDETVDRGGALTPW
jgi:hypothetical protein